jgi:hypothetical protein
MKTTNEIQAAFESIFNAKQIDAIKLIVRNGFWGDCDMEFNNDVANHANGHTTNMGKGKEYSGLMSGISKIIKSQKPNFITHISDWWQDGSGDMMFFNMEIIDEEALDKWAGN